MLDLVKQNEKQKIEAIKAILSALPSEIFPDTIPEPNTEDGTEETLSAMYTALAEAVGETKPTSKGYYKFVESVTEITQGHADACSGPPESRVTKKDIPKLVRQYVDLKGSPDVLQDLQKTFGEILCLDSDTSKMKRQPCTCPAGGLDGGLVTTTCQFFRCLDPKDDYKPLFGFDFAKGQSLGFVVDTTGSMAEEIAAAKEVITKLIASEEDVNVYAYVLTPFNDGTGLSTF